MLWQRMSFQEAINNLGTKNIVVSLRKTRGIHHTIKQQCDAIFTDGIVKENSIKNFSYIIAKTENKILILHRSTEQLKKIAKKFAENLDFESKKFLRQTFDETISIRVTTEQKQKFLRNKKKIIAKVRELLDTL